MYVLYQESEPQVQFAGQVQLEGALAQVAGDDHTAESCVKTGDGGITYRWAALRNTPNSFR